MSPNSLEKPSQWVLEAKTREKNPSSGYQSPKVTNKTQAVGTSLQNYHKKPTSGSSKNQNLPKMHIIE